MTCDKARLFTFSDTKKCRIAPRVSIDEGVLIDLDPFCKLMQVNRKSCRDETVTDDETKLS